MDILFENAQGYIIDLLRRWELRLIMLLSLLLQILLVTLGSRRRFVHRRLQLIVWCAYKMADSVATLGLGVISNLLSHMKDEKATGSDMHLMAFWSSILLLHLAGPDTITAYTTEDNEMWLAHLLKLLVPLGVVGYIYLMFLLDSPLFSIMALTIISIGLLKYMERSLSLFLTSKNQLVESFPSPKPSRGPFLIPHNSKDYKRSASTMDVIDEEQQRHSIGNDHDRMSSSSIYCAINAYEKMKILFIDGFLRDSVVQKLLTKTTRKIEKKKIFSIVEVEFGFVKELLYTKAMILSNKWGVFSRAATISALGIVLVVSSVEIINRNNLYIDDPVNVAITILLVMMSFLLELLSALLMLSSNWSSPYMFSRRFINFLRRIGGGTPKWRCGVVAQFSVFHFSLHKSSPCLQKVPKVEKLFRKLQEYFYVTYKELDHHHVKEVQEWIYHRVEEKVNEIYGDTSKIKAMLSGYQLRKILMDKDQLCADTVQSSSKGGHFDFDERILIWHITTDTCYYTDRKDIMMRNNNGDANANAVINNYKMSKMISRYMIYLLLVYPSMLSIQGPNKYDKTFVDVRNIFKGMPNLNQIRKNRQRWWKLIFNYNKDEKCSSCTRMHKRHHNWFLCESCHTLLGDKEGKDGYNSVGDKEGKDGYNSVLRNAQKMAKSMRTAVNLDSKWEEIVRIWVEALLFAAGNSSGPEHIKSLGQGEELLSHVWLLMAHFGITKQIKLE